MSAKTNKSVNTVRTVLTSVLIGVIAIGFVANAQPPVEQAPDLGVEPEILLAAVAPVDVVEPIMTPVLVPERPVPPLPTAQETLLGLSKVCYSESRRQSDCNAIWQTARTIRGCVDFDGAYVRCSAPHARREAPLEALRRHSGRVLGVRPTTRRRLLAIQQLQLNDVRPALMDRSAWDAAERHAWQESREWAHDAIRENPNVCSRGPSTWGGPGIDGDRIARMTGPEGNYDIVNCGDTANRFLRVRR